jgi:hypothetical protein
MDKKNNTQAKKSPYGEKEIFVEVWDRNEESDVLDMTITIYNGTSQSLEFDSLSISPADAVQVTGVSLFNLDGYTEWCNDSELLTKDLPKDIRTWATATLAKYLDVRASSLHEVAMLIMQLNSMQVRLKEITDQSILKEVN